MVTKDKQGKKFIYKGIRAKHIVLSMMTVVFLAINQDIVNYNITSNRTIIWNILSSIKWNSMTYYCIFPLLIFFYSYVESKISYEDIRQEICTIIPSLIFSFFMVFGYSFYMTDSMDLVTNIKSCQPIKSLLIGIGYSILFYYLIAFSYYILDCHLFCKSYDMKKYSKKIVIIGKYYEWLKKNPFLTVFFTLLLAYIPYTIVSYPAIFFEDAQTQIIQAYPELGYVEPLYLENHLLSEDVLLNNHHPIIHTLLMHVFIECGKNIFDSVNVGIFLFALLQMLLLLVVISYTAKLLMEQFCVREGYIIIMIIYYIFSPRIQNYMFVVTKDIYYSIFAIIFINYCSAILDEQKNKKIVSGLVLSSIGMCLSRNEGKYVIIMTCIIIAILNKQIRKIMFMNSICIAIFSVIFSQILVAYKITPGGKREMLSVPLQQTARYVRDYSDEVTEEEEDAIRNIVHYSHLGEDYNPDISDSVKWRFREHATQEELRTYAKVWLAMFIKHPGVYVQATMNNYYAYFYSKGQPFEGCSYELSQECMEVMNNKLQPLEMEFSYPMNLNETRLKYEKVREKIAKIPIISLVMMPATYTWLLFLQFFYSIKSKNKRAVSLLVMPWIILMICLLGPCNGYYCRYLYPIMICLPGIIPRIDYFITKNK